MFALEFIQNYAKNRKSNRIFSDHIRELANPEEDNSKGNTNDGRFVLSDKYGAVFNHHVNGHYTALQTVYGMVLRDAADQNKAVEVFTKNLLRQNGSFVVLDPEERVYKNTREKLERDGCKIKVLDLGSMKDFTEIQILREVKKLINNKSETLSFRKHRSVLYIIPDKGTGSTVNRAIPSIIARVYDNLIIKEPDENGNDISARNLNQVWVLLNGVDNFLKIPGYERWLATLRVNNIYTVMVVQDEKKFRRYSNVDGTYNYLSNSFGYSATLNSDDTCLLEVHIGDLRFAVKG